VIRKKEKYMPSEKEKMLRGDLYDALDPQLVMERRRARDITREFNTSRDDDTEKRSQLLATLFGKSGKNVWIEPPFYCDYGSNIYLGDNVYFNFNCVVLDVTRVEIGDHVLFGPNVQIYTATHPLDFQVRRQGLENALPVRIGSDAWVGGAAILYPGVTIGERTVLAAGSVVTSDIPSAVLAAGNPCRVIREL
jgi:maltose O-acetyltransferase